MKDVSLAGTVRSEASALGCGEEPERVQVVHDSKPKLLGYLLMSIGMLAGALATIRVGVFGAVVGAAGLLLFGGAGWVVVRRLFAHGPALVLDTYGIRDLRASDRPIPWSGVVRAEVQVVHGRSFVLLWLEDPEPYWESLRWYQRIPARLGPRMGFGHTALSTIGTQRSFQELRDYVAWILEEKRKQANRAGAVCHRNELRCL